MFSTEFAKNEAFKFLELLNFTKKIFIAHFIGPLLIKKMYYQIIIN